jgi:hypothetical protein
VLGHFGKGLRSRFSTIELARSVLFRMELLCMAWVLLSSVVRLELGHAHNRRAMFSGGRQGKAPRFSRISALQLMRNMRQRFMVWCTRLGLPLHPGEEKKKPPAPQSVRGSWAFRIFCFHRRFARHVNEEDRNQGVSQS